MPLRYLTIISSCCSLLFMIFGCCTPCDKPNRGQFTLKNESEDWIEIGNSVKSYANNRGETKVVNFSAPSTGFIQQVEDCEDDENCGLCCIEFEAESISVLASSVDLDLSMEFTLSKNFLRHSSDEIRENISDVLEIRVSDSGGLVCRLEDLPDPAGLSSIELNGKSFSQVFSCESQVVGNPPDSDQITAIYVNRAEGLLGWRSGTDEVWALIN